MHSQRPISLLMNKLAPDAVRLKPEHLDGICASVDWRAKSGGWCFDFSNGEDGGAIELIPTAQLIDLYPFSICD